MRFHRGLETYFMDQETFSETEARLAAEAAVNADAVAAEIAEHAAMYGLVP